MYELKTVSRAAALLAGFAAGPALAGDFMASDWAYMPEDNASFEIRGSLGAIGIEAREHVFAGSGSSDNVSLLIWQSAAPLATVEVDFVLPGNWTIAAEARGALMGVSYMEDYDWFGPDFVSYDFDDWTHRSQHSNTSLDWYFDGSLAVGHNVVVEPYAKVNVNAGLKYTDVQWAAVGGTYVYSGFDGDAPGGFRDNVGSFADEPGITYRQQLPALFAGIDAEVEDGNWTYATGLQAGVVLMGAATDHHWMRDLKFVDYLYPAPMVNLEMAATYSVSDNVGLHVSAAIEKMFLARADTEVSEISTGTPDGSYGNGAGAELGTISLSAGVTGRF